MHDSDLTAQLRATLGDEGLVRLTQALGGTRVYVPYSLRDGNEIVQAIGRDLAEKLSAKFAPAQIKVPLARRERALWYRSMEFSNAAIALKLGITESGVEKLFAREDNLPRRPRSGKSTRQYRLL